MTEWLQVCEAIKNYYGEETYWRVASDSVSVQEFYQLLEQVPDVEVLKNANGTYRGYHVRTPIEIETGSSVASQINSNVSSTQTSNVSVPLNTTVNQQTGNVIVETGAKATVAGTTAVATVAKPKNWIPALTAVGMLITLGKITTPELYENLPDFFKDLPSMDPEKWASITSAEVDEHGEPVEGMDGLIRVDENNNATAYMDKDAMTYVIKYMIEKGAFDTGSETISETSLDNMTLTDYIDMPVNIIHAGEILQFNTTLSGRTYYYSYKATGNSKMIVFKDIPSPSTDQIRLVIASADNSAGDVYRGVSNSGYVEPTTLVHPGTYSYTYDNKIVNYSITDIVAGFVNATNIPFVVINNAVSVFRDLAKRVSWLMIYDYNASSGGVPGIEQEEGATTPSFSRDDDYDDIYRKISGALPNIVDDAITQDVVQPDGTVIQYEYVPFVMPVPNDNPTEGKSPLDEPISGNQRQGDEDIDPEYEELTDYVYDDTVSPRDENIESTGGGSTPPVVIPPGSAEALYKIYNPTESQINSFGAWLWSSNFVDQLLKMFNDPMQAIISLHKVFCTPSVGGVADIKVGYLNSGVSSNYVDEQYVTVPCGSVELKEDFQNVFDYPPFTEVSLYLPFIGVVRLDVNDVMRSTITVTYHVDVLTGSCLAEVSVIRDTFGGVLYQYAGDCSVHYPLSSGSYMGIVSALLGVAGTVASGGALAPMMIGATAKALGGRASVERSGGFSGNAGAMGGKKPYLIIQRPQTNLANVFETFVGKPANYTTKISDCTGFISCTEVHIENCNGTDSELAELENLLKTGILI